MTPTPEQIEQCHLVEQEVIELVGRLQAEGIDFRVIMAGAGTGMAALLLSAFGPDAVPTWFAQQSAMTMHLAKK